MEIENCVNLRIGGRFHLTLRDKNGNVKKELGFNNLITDSGLERIVTGQTLGTNAALIGNGTTEPSFADTKLTGTLWWWTSTGRTESTVRYNKTTPPYWAEVTHKLTFNSGVATGTHTEVGMGPSNGSNIVSVRTLIKDNDGNPISIEKGPEDFLDIAYTFRTYIPNEDIPFTYTIDGVEHTGFFRPLGLSDVNYNKWQPFLNRYNPSVDYCYCSTGDLPAIHATSSQVGAALTSSPNVTRRPNEILISRVTGEYKNRYTLSWNPDIGNIAIKSILISSFWDNDLMMYGVQFNTPVVKTNKQRFRLVFDIEVSRG